MIRRYLLNGIFILAGGLLASCTTLKSEHYVGTKETIPVQEIKKETIWQYEDAVYYVRVLDSLNAIASTLEWDENNKRYQVQTFEVVVTSLGDDKFLNIKGEDRLYTILRMAGAMDGTIVFFTVNEEQINEDIRRGIVKATKKNSEFILEMRKAELDQYIAKNIDHLFNVRSPGIIKPLVEIERENK
jgi:hypothetical protein